MKYLVILIVLTISDTKADEVYTNYNEGFCVPIGKELIQENAIVKVSEVEINTLPRSMRLDQVKDFFNFQTGVKEIDCFCMGRISIFT